MRLPFRQLGFAVISMCAVYAIALLIVYAQQHRYVYYPPAPSPWAFDVRISSSDMELGGWVLKQHPKKAVVVFGGNAQSLAGWRLPQGVTQCTDWTFILVPYRGYEGQPGTPNEQALVSDGQQVVAWAAEQYDQVAVLGVSLGSGVAMAVARNDQHKHIDRLLLATPYDSLANVGQDLMPWMLPHLLLRDQFDSAKRAPFVVHPVSILTAQDDEVIGRQRTQNLIQAFGRPVDEQVVAGTHESVWKHPDTCRWMTHSLS